MNHSVLFRTIYNLLCTVIFYTHCNKHILPTTCNFRPLPLLSVDYTKVYRCGNQTIVLLRPGVSVFYACAPRQQLVFESISSVAGLCGTLQRHACRGRYRFLSCQTATSESCSVLKKLETGTKTFFASCVHELLKLQLQYSKVHSKVMIIDYESCDYWL